MKIRLVFAVIASAIGFVCPTFAQQKDTADSQTTQQIRALSMKYDEAYNKNDAVAVAALFTEDAARVTPDETYHGRQAIEKSYAKTDFQRWHTYNMVTTVDRVTVVGNDVFSFGRWTCIFQGPDGHAKSDAGRYSMVLVREGNTWKIGRETESESNPHATK